MIEDRKQTYKLALLESRSKAPEMPNVYHRKVAWHTAQAESDYVISIPSYARKQGMALKRISWHEGGEEECVQETPPEHPYPDPWAAARKICKPQEYKLLLELYYHDTKLGQIATQWGIHKGTLSKLRKKALAKLRRYLELHNV